MFMYYLITHDYLFLTVIERNLDIFSIGFCEYIDMATI